MPKISALEQQKRNPDRVNVYLDGTFAFGVSLASVLAKALRVGDELSEATRLELDEDDEIEGALGRALNLLSYRPRSRREIESYFRRRQLDPAIAEAVIDRLSRAGLLDDREFARFWVENREQFRPRGARALRAEMRQKGLDSDTIEEALSDIGDEDESALAAGERKARSLATVDEREFFRKMVGFLQRRGYPYQVAARSARALRAAVSGPPSEDEEVGY